MFGWDFEVNAWSRFWRWNLIEICVKTCDMTLISYFVEQNSTLESVVPLAMCEPLTPIILRASLTVCPLSAGTYSSSVVAPIAKISKGDLEAMPRVAQKQRNWTPKFAVCVPVPLSLCAPSVHRPLSRLFLDQSAWNFQTTFFTYFL